MEPIVVIVSGHVFSARDDEVRVVAEPYTVQNYGIKPIHNIPKGISCKDPTPEGGTAVDISNQEPEEHTEHEKGCEFLKVEGNSSRLVGIIYEPKSPAAFYDGWWIVEDNLDGISRHQEHKEREKRASDDGFKEKHSAKILKMSAIFTRG